MLVRMYVCVCVCLCICVHASVCGFVCVYVLNTCYVYACVGIKGSTAQSSSATEEGHRIWGLYVTVIQPTVSITTILYSPPYYNSIGWTISNYCKYVCIHIVILFIDVWCISLYWRKYCDILKISQSDNITMLLYYCSYWLSFV